MSSYALSYSDIIPINLDRLNVIDSGPFSMSYAFDLGPLRMSIRKVGLINPPVVRKNSQGGIDIVTGFRRVETMKSLGLSEIPCRFVQDTTPSLKCLHLNLYDNLAVRTLNDVEVSMALNRLVRLVPQEEILARYMPLLNLRPRISLFHYYTTLENLEPSIKDGIAKKNISPQTVRALQDKEHDTRIMLMAWISDLKLNFNQQKQFIEYIEDICIKENVDLSDLYKDTAGLKTVREQDMNSPQKAKRVLEYLRSRRFPRLSRTEKLFQSRVSKMKLPKGVSIRHPPHFEGSNYLLEITFKDGENLMGRIKELAVSREISGMNDPGGKHDTK